MHISGKILLFLVIAGAVGSSALMAHMMKVRNSWMKANVDLQKSNDDNVNSISQKEAELAELRRELKTTLQNWGTPITGFNVTQANATSVSVSIGTRNGVISGQNRQPPGENPVLQAFRPTGNGNEFVWVGPLRVQSVTDTSSVLEPTWSVRTGEADPWNAQNQRWHVWERIPGGANIRFTDLQQRLYNADVELQEKNNFLTRQQQLLVAAKTQNQQRLAELLGPPNKPAAADKLLGMESTHGFLAAIAAEDEARNTLQADIDGLRRQLKLAFATLKGATKDNTVLIKELPAPPVTSGP